MRRPGMPCDMIGILLTVIVAALVYALCVALGLPAIVAIVAAILVLLAGFPAGVYGGRRGASKPARRQVAGTSLPPAPCRCRLTPNDGPAFARPVVAAGAAPGAYS